MIDNFNLISQRISSYFCAPDGSFKASMGYSAFEENVAQKLRQFWADKNIPNSEKLKDFDYDLSEFDPENTSFIELRDITNAMYDAGLIDDMSSSFLAGQGCEYNSLGNQINMDKKINVIEHLRLDIEHLNVLISEGRDYAKDTLTCINLSVTVILVLKERAEMMRASSLVHVKI
ncbi:MAG: hypothetical protein ACOH2R_17280 [Pseudomonas sp.]